MLREELQYVEAVVVAVVAEAADGVDLAADGERRVPVPRARPLARERRPCPHHRLARRVENMQALQYARGGWPLGVRVAAVHDQVASLEQRRGLPPEG